MGMTLTGSKAILGLQSKFKPTNTNVTNEIQIGKTSEIVQFPFADTIYSLQAFFANSGANFTLNQLTGVASNASTWNAGRAQVIKTTAIGTITGNGFVTLSVAGASFQSLSKNVSVNIGDTQNQWAAKVRNALLLDATFLAYFEISGTENEIILTRKPQKTIFGSNVVVNYYFANIANLNVSIDGRNTGATSNSGAQLVSGIETEGCLVLDGDGKDIEGKTISELAKIEAFFAKVIGGGILLTDSASLTLSINDDGHLLQTQFQATNPISFQAYAPTSIQLTILGKSIDLQPEISLEIDGIEIERGGSYDFGELFLGQDKAVNVTIRNIGNGPLELVSIPVVYLETDPDFSISTYPSAIIGAGQESVFTINFNPIELTQRYSTLFIDNTDANESPFYVNLTGTGI